MEVLTMKNSIAVINANEVVTCSGFSGKAGKEAMNDIGVIKNGHVVVLDGIIKYVGTDKEKVDAFVKEHQLETIDASGKTVTPGYVDPHTHFVFGGYRADEYNWRLQGVTYTEIMERGGGIINSVSGTHEASEEELLTLGVKRLNSMMKMGVTTVEGKSGYGLDKDTELKQLRVMKKLNEMHSMDIVTTFLGAHSKPKEFKHDEMGFINFIIDEVLPVVVEENLAEFCDIFTEKNVFSVEASRILLQKAKDMGMKLKLHADEIVQLGGSELAAELGATSADHLLKASDQGIKDMAKAGVVATLLPCTAFSLKEDFAKARQMIDEGCMVALATDFNPGSCFTESIPLVIALSTIHMKMTVEEMLTALTINAAHAVGRADTVGSIDEGKKGDLLIHEFPSYSYIPYHICMPTVEKVIKNGRLVVDHFSDKPL